MKTALLVIDLQQDVVADCWDAAGVVARSWALVQRARREGVPVFWTQHEASGLATGTPGWEFAPPLAPEPPEPVVHKRYRDAFAQTGLGDWLSDLEVTRLVVCGARSDHCVRATTHRAVAEGFDVTLVADAHTAADGEWDSERWTGRQIVAHTNHLWSTHRSPGQQLSLATHNTVSLKP